MRKNAVHMALHSVMLNSITTVLMALVFTALMLWWAYSPFLAPQLFFRAHCSTEVSAGTVQAKTVAQST